MASILNAATTPAKIVDVKHPENPSLPSLRPTPSAPQGMGYPRISCGGRRHGFQQGNRDTGGVPLPGTPGGGVPGNPHLRPHHRGTDAEHVGPGRLPRSRGLRRRQPPAGPCQAQPHQLLDNRQGGGTGRRTHHHLEQFRTRARWQELLNIARYSLGRQDFPTGTELNLAVDRCYFAMYHALCHSNAQSLAGKLRARRRDDWSRVYMGMAGRR